MKYALLGTTALVAAGLATSPAQAAQGVQLGLGGYYAGAAGLILDQDDGAGDPGQHTRDVVFRQEVEVHFQGDTTLDNGLTVGARIEMDGQQSDDQIDEVWAYFKGGWGQIRFGDDDDASEQLSYLIPTASNIFGVDSPSFEFSNNHGNNFNNGLFQTNSTVLNISGDATKIMYFSPTFAGFNFGLSYAPDFFGENSYSYWSQSGGTTLSNNSGQIQNVVSAALNFEQDFEAFSIQTGVAFGEGQFESTGGDHNVKTSWGAAGHLDVVIGGLTLGVNGTWRDNWQSASGADYWVAGVGGTYNWDAWTVGLAWSHGDYEYANSGGSSDTIDIVQVTGRYDLAEAISIDAMVGYNTMDGSSGTGHADDNTWEAGIGFYLGF